LAKARALVKAVYSLIAICIISCRVQGYTTTDKCYDG
jgi:hypothetical protein